MRLDELQYDLPPELIAQQPAEPRDSARLLVLDRATGEIAHHVFRDVVEYLRAGDCLVVNDTQVIPARFHCRRATSGRIEGLFLRADGQAWRVLLKRADRLRPGERLACERGELDLVVEERHERGEWSLRPVARGGDVPPAADAAPSADMPPPADALTLLGRIGETPLPPYIHRDGRPDATDAQRYQTVYASRPGAVAAPTAGLHFTPELLARLEQQGVRRTHVTLHVGPGTFQPIEAEDLSRHVMHSEWFELPVEAAAAIDAARAAGGRVVAVGTTSVRVLESAASQREAPASARRAGASCRATPLHAAQGWTQLFIYPPYAFRCVDALLTNFHLPGSTLLALVIAFAGVELTRRAYAAAIAEQYRFYSYGDAMLIL